MNSTVIFPLYCRDNVCGLQETSQIQQITQEHNTNSYPFRPHFFSILMLLLSNNEMYVEEEWEQAIWHQCIAAVQLSATEERTVKTHRVYCSLLLKICPYSSEALKGSAFTIKTRCPVVLFLFLLFSLLSNGKRRPHWTEKRGGSPRLFQSSDQSLSM